MKKLKLRVCECEECRWCTALTTNLIPAGPCGNQSAPSAGCDDCVRGAHIWVRPDTAAGRRGEWDRPERKEQRQ